MNTPEIEKKLTAHGVRPTAVRIVVWAKISAKTNPFTLKDVEAWLPWMDRSSIFRALRLFAKQQLLHEIDDGSGICKYCVCRCEANNHAGHVHFVCTKCRQAECLTDTFIPAVPLPEGYELIEAEYVIKGICRKCRK